MFNKPKRLTKYISLLTIKKPYWRIFSIYSSKVKSPRVGFLCSCCINCKCVFAIISGVSKSLIWLDDLQHGHLLWKHRHQLGCFLSSLITPLLETKKESILSVQFSDFLVKRFITITSKHKTFRTVFCNKNDNRPSRCNKTISCQEHIMEGSIYSVCFNLLLLCSHSNTILSYGTHTITTSFINFGKGFISMSTRIWNESWAMQLPSQLSSYLLSPNRPKEENLWNSKISTVLLVLKVKGL